MLGTASAAACLWLCAAATSPALAQDASSSGAAANGYLNEQVQMGDVVAGQKLDVQEADGGATTVTTAVGSTVSASGQNADLAFQSKQKLSGAVSATSNPAVNGYAGPYMISSTSATGNSATAATCCGTVSGTSVQKITSNGVGATTNAYLGGYSSYVEADSTAVGDTQGWNVSNGVVSAKSRQSSTGGVTAATSASTGSADSASYTATAVANDVEAQTTNSPVNLKARQVQDGVTQALVDASVQNAGDSVATASAVANNANVISDSWGDSVAVNQSNTGAVNSSAQQTLGAWYGTAANTSYGVGNSAVISNAGSYTGVSSNQSNGADITVSSALYSQVNGGAGGEAVSNATGVGNAVSAYACASCNGTVSARNKQVNSGSVRVTNTVGTQGLSGSVSGVSSAIGNTASYSVVGGSD
jgi:hypothetical protein